MPIARSIAADRPRGPRHRPGPAVAGGDGAAAGGRRTRRRRKPLPAAVGVLYVPNGMNMADWTPTAEGQTSTTCRRSSSRSQPVKDPCSVLTGLTCDKARANGDGPGDHARACRRSSPAPAAQDARRRHPGRHLGRPGRRPAVGEATRFPSLEIGCEPAAWPATATPATAASTLDDLLARRVRRRSRRRSIRGWSSSGCSATARPTRRPRPAHARTVPQEHPRLRARGRQRPAARRSARPTGASSTST